LGRSGRVTNGVDVGLDVGVGVVAGLGAEVVETGRGVAAPLETATGTARD
jgi:hypothetical protein